MRAAIRTTGSNSGSSGPKTIGMPWGPKCESPQETRRRSPKCTAGADTRATMECGCTSDSMAIPKWIASKSNGSEVGSTYLKTSPPINCCGSSKAPAVEERGAPRLQFHSTAWYHAELTAARPNVNPSIPFLQANADMPTPSRSMSRRKFFRKSTAAAAVVAMPTFISANVLRSAERAGANDRIGIGFIGAGRRANQLTGLPSDSQIVAIADCDLRSANAMAKKFDCRAYQYYKEMLESKDVKAVVVATPDHWHTLREY